MFYTTDAEAARAFLRDKLGLPAHDVGDGWLIFDAPEVEIGCHPSEKRFHGISFYCDDIEKTVADLRDRGVTFKAPVKDQGYGLVTTFSIPGGGEVELYQPKYEKR
jgi:catechol 2,3-dioxygenase-like lactoylglutathione lyase family enzyme